MVSSSFPSTNSRDPLNSSTGQNPRPSFANPDSPPHSTSHSGHIPLNDHQHKKRRLSPPIAHAAAGPALSCHTIGVYHSRGSGTDSYPQGGHSEQIMSRDVGGNTDSEIIGLGEDEIRGRPRSPAQGIPRRMSSGSSSAAVARHPSVNARAPPSMSTSMLTSAASTQSPANAMSTDPSGAGASKQWKTPTGHRRGITVKEMLPLDAPTQPRRRSIPANGTGSRPTTSSGVPHPQSPSAPFSFLGQEEQTHGTLRPIKRPRTSSSIAESLSPAHSSALSLELDPEYGSPDLQSTSTILPPVQNTHLLQSAQPFVQRSNARPGTSDSPASTVDPSMMEDPVALKRRQNTIAARRSRQRKLEHVRSLEKQVDGLTRERDELRSRVARLEDRVAFLKEIVAGNGGGSGAVAMSPRTTSRGARQMSGKRAAPTTQWDENDADELYDDDTGRDEEYGDEY